jgi:hypothetical protein
MVGSMHIATKAMSQLSPRMAVEIEALKNYS